MLVDCLMQVYRIGFLVTSLPVNCNDYYPVQIVIVFYQFTVGFWSHTRVFFEGADKCRLVIVTEIGRYGA